MRQVLLVCLGFIVACGTDETEPDDNVDSLEDVPTGEFAMGISLAPVGGLLVPFQLDLTPGNLDDGSRVFSEVVVRATDNEWTLSEPLQTFSDIKIGDDNSFTLEFSLTMPAEYSPTMSPVEIVSTLAGSFDGNTFLCGDVSGQITTFDMDLAGSTFAAVDWDVRDNGLAASCDDKPGATLPRMDAADCPDLSEGMNTGFLSAGVERAFEVRLPDSYSADEDVNWPVVVAWHGFGGTAQGFINGDLSTVANSRDVILIAPQGIESNSTTAFDPFGDESRNLDVALFDDLVTCAQAKLNADSDRIYSTGMSNGGLMTGAILARRARTLAAAAPLSGGIGVAFAEDHVSIPTFVMWGGPEDFAYEQDFHKLALNMVDELETRGHFMAVCEHALQHDIPEGAWDWVFTFLLSHTKSSGTSSPFEAGLPEEFPDYCVVNSPN